MLKNKLQYEETENSKSSLRHPIASVTCEGKTLQYHHSPSPPTPLVYSSRHLWSRWREGFWLPIRLKRQPVWWSWSLREGCVLYHGKKVRTKSSFFCKAPRCQAQAKSEHYWLCLTCFPLHMQQMAGDYDTMMGVWLFGEKKRRTSITKDNHLPLIPPSAFPNLNGIKYSFVFC